METGCASTTDTKNMKPHYTLSGPMRKHTFVYYLTVPRSWWHLYDLTAPDVLRYTQNLYGAT